MGLIAPPLYGTSKFYENKKAKALKKIAELQAVVAECDKQLAKK